MRAYFIVFLAFAAIIFGCAPPPAKLYPLAEMVMKPGESMVAVTPTGIIKITADDELARTYTWEGAARSARLSPRTKRWDGLLGAYFPGPGDHWIEHNGITRGVLQEGQLHFDGEEEALAWIRKPWHQEQSVYRDDGLFVLFAKVPERRQINVDVIQILIRGRKPAMLPGSQNDKVLMPYKGV